MPDPVRATFFKLLFGAHEGYVCISRMPLAVDSGGWKESFFEWPRDAERMEDYIEAHKHFSNMYFCPQLLIRPRRRKDCIKTTTCAWADLDTCAPSDLFVRPTITVESSPSRYQAYWLFADESVAPFDAQDISRRIAYGHAASGADKSGWDLSQVLRIPNTNNFKYLETGIAPEVKIIDIVNDAIPLQVLTDNYPQVAEFKYLAELPMPDRFEDAADVIMRHQKQLNPYAVVLYSQTPKDHEWSTSLWNMEMMLFENGLKIEEVFSIARESACNKYERDNRGDVVLWKELLRAKERHEMGREATGALTTMFDGPGQLLTDEERAHVAAMPNSFIEDYIEWATASSDASPQYHQAGAFVALSSLLSSKVRLPTGPDIVQLNLWFQILGDTTLTRKTTAMNMAMNLLEEVDDNVVLATDGSIEGLFTAMGDRPGRASVFLRDEFSGLLRAMSSKDYMAGMMESLTKLYDGKFQKRILRKETIEVKEPVFIFFTGGIKTAIMELYSRDHVISGFLPRFIFITAEADITKIKPLGPPTRKNDQTRKALVDRLKALHEHYHSATMSVTFKGVTKELPKRWEATLTEEAWLRYNQFEMSLLYYGESHEESLIMTPSMSRLSMSGLKVATLLAAERRLEDEVVVTEDDILHAFSYVERWRDYLIEVLENINKSPYEKIIDLVVAATYKEPGIMRGTVMRLFRMSTKVADDVLGTAEQRGMIKIVEIGKNKAKLYPPNYNIGE